MATSPPRSHGSGFEIGYTLRLDVGQFSDSQHQVALTFGGGSN